MGALSDSVRAQRAQRQAARAPQEIVQEMVGYDPGFPNRPIASPLMYDERTGTYEWGIPQLAIDALENVVLPGAVLQGYQPSMADVTEFGAGVGTGGVAASTAGGVPRGALGMFAGPRARTADLEALAEARQMKTRGLADEDIWTETGWQHTGPREGLDTWRFEIPDNLAQIVSPRPWYSVSDQLRRSDPPIYRAIERYRGLPEMSQRQTESYHRLLDEQGVTRPGAEYKIAGNFEHPALFQAYPGLANVPFDAIDSLPRGVQGQFTYQPRPVGEGFRPTEAPGQIQLSKYAEDPTSTMLHELQHGVQAIEGLTPGANPARVTEGLYDAPMVLTLLRRKEDLMDRLTRAQTEGQLDDLNDELNLLEAQIEGAARLGKYRAHTGEIEARATQDRQPMTAGERELNMPLPRNPRQWD